MTGSGYQLVQLKNGVHSVHSLQHAETFHPVIGPVAEAETLYVRQLRLVERLQPQESEFVIWDVGLGAAANVLTVLRATREIPCPLRIVSFDRTLEPLEFALAHRGELGYLGGYEEPIALLLDQPGRSPGIRFTDGARTVEWEVKVADFPTLLKQAIREPLNARSAGNNVVRAATPAPVEPRPAVQTAHHRTKSTAREQIRMEQGPLHEPSPAGGASSESPGIPGRRITPRSGSGWEAADAIVLPPPHAILFDAFSPATNPEMWTLALFTSLFRLLDPPRPCAMPTYSRSTMLRVTLLLAGFFVGAGHATGEKEETTVAANTLGLLEEPLDRRWLNRSRRSTSAEPLHEPVYRQARLSPVTWERLQVHPQFAA